MSIQIVIELSDQQGVQAVVQALETYQTRLRAGIARTRDRLRAFEQQHGVTTAAFLRDLTAEDLPGGDLAYVEWAGEARLLAGLETELHELEYARVQLP